MSITSDIKINSILQNISEGILTIEFNGVISYANPAAHAILGFDEGTLPGKLFSTLFFDRPENDEFTQAVLDAVYESKAAHSTVVRYTNSTRSMHLRMSTSYLKADQQTLGVIVVFGDLSGLIELHDAVETVDRIRELNNQLMLRNELISRTFGRYLSDEIVRRLLDTPDGLSMGGQSQYLTILMSDLRGFTSLSDQMDPADLVSMLNHYLGEMTEILQSRGGSIIEFIGDGILAIFGAHGVSARHESQAIAAALEMQQRMEMINQWNSERGFPRLEMGIGINTGNVIIGNIGSEKRTKYGVVGNHVNLCGRIESCTVGGQVLVSQATKEGSEAELEIKNSLSIQPKGAAEQLQLFDVTGIGLPYDVRLSLDISEPVPLAEPCNVRYRLIENKQLLPGKMIGQITAVSKNLAVMETEATLNLLQDIQLEGDFSLYCKVIEKTDSGYLLRFTSAPQVACRKQNRSKSADA